jgi:hypothetical protein
MTGPRLTLSGMLGLIALVGLGLGALRSASVFWVSAVSWVLLFWLCAALLGVIFARGASRVFWTGFALFGWAYLVLVHSSLMSTTLSAEMSTGVHHMIEAALPFDPNALPKGANPFDARHAHSVRLIRLRVLADLYSNFAFAVTGGLLAGRFARCPVPSTPAERRGPEP